jgi:ligand-binding SRPBCC domain-containing protein
VTAEFTQVTILPVSPPRAFELSLSVEAHLRSMARSRERAVGAVTSGTLTLGDEVTWRAWHFGVPWQMTSRVTECEPPHRFVDEQVRGPFRAFRHEHLFTAAGDGTLMTDQVAFTAPFGVLGRLAERVVLRRYLAQLIGARNRYLAAAAARAAG